MKIIVLKIGGKELDKDEELDMFASCVKEITEAGLHCVLVHGGGNRIDARLKQLNIMPRYLNGVRVTDEETMKVVEEVLCGEVQDRLIDCFLNRKKIMVLTFPSKEHRPVKAVRTQNKALGLVGEITKIDSALLKTLLKSGYVSFFAPIAADENGHSLNVNADVFASKLAAELKAQALTLITDVPGVYDESNNVIPSLSAAEAKKLMRAPVIKSGMLPKLSACVDAVGNGVKKAYILDSKTLTAKLKDVLAGRACGTMIH